MNVVDVFVSPRQQTAKVQEQTEDVNGKAEKGSEDKMPVHTLSLHPGEFRFVCVPLLLSNGLNASLKWNHLVPAAVVVLETLNSALQKQESLTAMDKVFRLDNNPISTVSKFH